MLCECGTYLLCSTIICSSGIGGILSMLLTSRIYSTRCSCFRCCPWAVICLYESYRFLTVLLRRVHEECLVFTADVINKSRFPTVLLPIRHLDSNSFFVFYLHLDMLLDVPWSIYFIVIHTQYITHMHPGSCPLPQSFPFQRVT